MVVVKGDLEVQLKDEHQLIRDGVLKDDSPLDVSAEYGSVFLEVPAPPRAEVLLERALPVPLLLALGIVQLRCGHC